MSDVRWIALHCGEDALALLANHPRSFLLLTQIAMRARWKDCPITKLKAGEAFIGDWKSAGLDTEGEYRHAKKVLIDCKLATFTATNKGTRATLANAAIFSISTDATTDRATGQRQANNRPTTTNHTETQNTQNTEDHPNPQGGMEAGDKELRILPSGWQRLTTTTRKQTRVNANSKAMNRIGNFFNRRDGTLWSVAEAVALQNISPSPEEVGMVEIYYTARIEKDDDYRRRDLLTLLNNWPGELDRSRVFMADNGIKLPSQ